MRGISGSSVRAFFGRFGIALVLAAAVTTTAVASVNHEIDTRVKRIKRIELLTAEAPPQGANYLIIGSDTREFVDNDAGRESFGDPSTETGKNSDTLMVAHVEPSAQRTFVVSFPRDLMVTIPGQSGKNRINAAYGIGGPQLVIDTLKENFDIAIHHYVEVDFKSFQDVVDAIGNVRIYIPGRVRDVETGLLSPYGAGCFPLDGPSALQYVRSRSLEISDPNGPIVDPDTGEHWRLLDVRADLDRIPRQQEFIRRLAGLAISKSLDDPFLGLDIADRVLGDIKADTGLGRSDVNALIRSFKTVDVNDPNSVQFETLPYAPDPSNPNVTLVPGPGADEVIARLQTFGSDAAPPPSVLPAQVTVQVLDGAGQALAQDTLTKLVQHGFQSDGYGTAHRKISQSEIRYGPDHLNVAKALVPYVADAKLVKDPSLVSNLVLVLGSTFVGLTVDPTVPTLPPAPVAPAPVTTAPRATATTAPPASEQC